MERTTGGSTPGRRQALPLRPGRTPGADRAYERYCRRQAMALLSLVPREALRPLYRRARRWAAERSVHRSDDPMATLVAFCRTLLPLPPPAVWHADRRAHPLAHLQEDPGEPGEGGAATPPVMVDRRPVRWRDRDWIAGLGIFRGDDAWRGFIAFEDARDPRARRTADIFVAADPDEIRERFRSFGSETLAAFLRSVSP